MRDGEPEAWRPSEVIGRQVQSFRERHGWSLAELAERLVKLGARKDPATLSRLENGKRVVSVEEWLQLSAVLGVPPIALIVDDWNRWLEFREGIPYDGGLVRSWIEGNDVLINSPDDPLYVDERLYNEVSQDDLWQVYRALAFARAAYEAAQGQVEHVQRFGDDELQDQAEAVLTKARSRLEVARQRYQEQRADMLTMPQNAGDKPSAEDA